MPFNSGMSTIFTDVHFCTSKYKRNKENGIIVGLFEYAEYFKHNIYTF